MKISVLLFVLVFAPSPLSSAQAPDPPAMGKWWNNSDIVSQLKLTASQINKIEQRFLDYRPTLADLNSEIKKREEELAASMKSDPMDETKVRELTKVVISLRSELEKANSFMMIAFRKELTNKQWDKLQRIRESRQAQQSALEVPVTTFSQSGEQVYVYRPGGPVKSPRPLTHSLPPYTQMARAAGVEGSVLLQGIVLKDGRLTELRILRGLGYGLDESAAETAGRWRFQPGTLNGQPVNVQVNITISFRPY